MASGKPAEAAAAPAPRDGGAIAAPPSSASHVAVAASASGVLELRNTATTSKMEGRQVRLIDYLTGHVLRRGLMLFEDALGAWIKAEMAAHFPDDPADPHR
eukprot:CAMPEP_0206331306 /NCGR_PEP_ID=MMETSP0106_2-20121207/24173_1 /ASSEMBLY_ACC=CAM_ASM_000206 /TAXON_ID=81532 /ORGANISM="Acanthoeca-like sp., Strain 10tr" /LENGTH=100 /DNA_ID=CAMNT_0053764105 /DNA_START=341 /DNA_END=640 /DNA_ORIENTATION=+